MCVGEFPNFYLQICQSLFKVTSHTHLREIKQFTSRLCVSVRALESLNHTPQSIDNCGDTDGADLPTEETAFENGISPSCSLPSSNIS